MEDSQEKDYSFLGNDTFPNLYDALQYVALGPRVKVIILNILPELKPDGLKFSLKIDLMSLAIIAK